jgi:hypothetical protein
LRLAVRIIHGAHRPRPGLPTATPS